MLGLGGEKKNFEGLVTKKFGQENVSLQLCSPGHKS
jgi:hypothetical protein